MPVKGGKVDNYVALLNKFLKFCSALEIIILERNSYEFLLFQSEKVIKVCSYKSGLAGDTDMGHGKLLQFQIWIQFKGLEIIIIMVDPGF